MKSWLWRFQLGETAFAFAIFCLTFAVPVQAADAAAGDKTVEAGATEPYLSPTNGLGSWIWATNTYDGQVCHLWRTFEVPDSSTVANARLVMTVDNEFTLYLDGRELGRGAEWRELYVFDLTQLLSSGKHILAVEAMNSFTEAGMLLGLRVDLADGRTIEIKSDTSWRIAPEGVRHWEKRTEAAAGWPAAIIKAPLGGSPWWVQPLSVNKIPTLQPVTVHFWGTGWFQVTLLCVCGIVILISLRLTAQLTFHRKERWLLHQERARIARDIHDDIGARMTQLVLHGELAQNGLRDDSEARSLLIQICEEARGLLSTMDEILWAVNPKRDTLRDFAAYVCNYAQGFLKSTPIQCLFEVDPEMSAADFTLPLRRSLLMAIKETLNNAVKHSGATELRLKIQWQGRRLIVVVQDNGRGFDPAIVKPERNGMTIMAQRMAELGGSCHLSSQPGKGCRVEFTIPLQHPRRHILAWLWDVKQVPGPTNNSKSSKKSETVQKHDPTKC